MNKPLNMPDGVTCPFCGTALELEATGELGIIDANCDKCDITIGPFVSRGHATTVLSRRSQPAAGGPLPEDVLETITEWLAEYERKSLAWSDLNANNELAVKYARQVDAIDAWLQRQRGERGGRW